MPAGMVVMKWDERVGADKLATYPSELLISDKTLMQIYSTHEYNQEAGMISMMVGGATIASYYTGPENSIYVILVLSTDEDPDLFEEGLADVSRQIIQNLENNAFESILPSLFQRVSVYPTLDVDQKLMMLYVDETKRILLKRLKTEGSLAKSEVNVWLKDKYTSGFVDIESVVSSFIKAGLIKQASVKGIGAETLFLVSDIMMYRVPPVDLLKEPQARGLPLALANDFTAECKAFFTSYTPNENDDLHVLNILLDPQVYETIKLLRTAIVTRDDLEKLKKKGVEDVEYVLKKLWEIEFISVLRDDNGNEYYGLKSDMKVKRVYPEYIINTIRQDFNDKVKNDQVLLEHLHILEENYQPLSGR